MTNKKNAKEPKTAPADLHLISCEEAGRRLALDGCIKDVRRSILTMARHGYLRSRRVGRYTMIDPRSVDWFLEFGLGC